MDAVHVLKTNQEFSLSILSLPTHPSLQNYFNSFRIGKMNYALFSSFFNTVITVPIIVIVSFIMGYFLLDSGFQVRSFYISSSCRE